MEWNLCKKWNRVQVFSYMSRPSAGKVPQHVCNTTFGPMAGIEKHVRTISDFKDSYMYKACVRVRIFAFSNNVLGGNIIERD